MKIQERNVEMFCCVSGDMNSEKVHELGWVKIVRRDLNYVW